MVPPISRVVVLAVAAANFLCADALQNGLALTPPRGFSTWNQWPDEMKAASGHSITERLARQYMNGMVAVGLNKLNYTYFIVDEPCFIGRAADGTLLENKTTWPNGLKSFGAELRSHGMKLGIYTCVGPKTCGGCVASEGHEEQDMQTFADCDPARTRAHTHAHPARAQPHQDGDHVLRWWQGAQSTSRSIHAHATAPPRQE